MKVAIATDNNMCSEHFGRCEGFKVYELSNNKIIDEGFIKNPGHKPNFLPVYLKEKGINVIISVDMGGNAQNIFKENNIEVIVGVTGKIDMMIKDYIDNKLKSDDSICNKHEFEGNYNE